MTQPAIIPRPVVFERRPGAVRLHRGVQVVLPGHVGPRWQTEAAVFTDSLESRFGVGPGATRIDVRTDPSGDVPPAEGYEIRVGEAVEIRAATSHGLHNALASLLQLVEERDGGPVLLGSFVQDFPRFGWRGFMLDPARSFLPPAVLRGMIDRIARLKLNVLHLHLTDDHGWRLEVPTFPRLHQVGGTLSSLSPLKRGALERHGWGDRGYYTCDELADIVGYAADRHVRVVPEIDVPGHTSAMLAAYPELSCSGDPVPLRTRPGIYRTALCPGKEAVYKVLREVFAEVTALFPDRYVHVGADEVAPEDWKGHLANLDTGETTRDGLLGYFLARVAPILRQHGRTLVAWDEALELLPAGSVVQAWHHHDRVRQAAERGLDVIASPLAYSYLDQPRSMLDLRRVYAFEPIPPDLDPGLHHHVLGGEATLWGEYVTLDNLVSKAFPRLTAHAEVMWSPAERRDFDDFRGRLAQSPD